MMNLELTKTQAIMLAGILGATEGQELTEVYRTITQNLNRDERILADDITALVYEEYITSEDVSVNEDYLYAEAKKLNGGDEQ